MNNLIENWMIELIKIIIEQCNISESILKFVSILRENNVINFNKAGIKALLPEDVDLSIQIETEFHKRIGNRNNNFNAMLPPKDSDLVNNKFVFE